MCEVCGTDNPARKVVCEKAAEPEAEPEPEPAAEPEPEGEKEVRKRKNWLPLESNPDLMNQYIHRLGVNPRFAFHEIMGVDDAMLEWVPKPVYAVLMLFPISAASEAQRADEEEKLQGQAVPEAVYHIKQTVGNACGTIGLLHAVLNNAANVELDPAGFFAKFYAQTKGMDLLERAAALEANEDIEESHRVVAAAGSSDVAAPVNAHLHFNAFVLVDGHVWELDGRKKRPIKHGPSTRATFLSDAVAVVKEFMARDPQEIRWNLVSLGEQ